MCNKNVIRKPLLFILQLDILRNQGWNSKEQIKIVWTCDADDRREDTTKWKDKIQNHMN